MKKRTPTLKKPLKKPLKKLVVKTKIKLKKGLKTLFQANQTHRKSFTPILREAVRKRTPTPKERFTHQHDG
ncbi:hypothetical protein BB410_06360 [Helicobacter pylori]|uniref:hypothetical protein n=1 Tax=Helicobacter pylori TaxID=210 RepID=UPI000BEB4803|nr:hypothetical protein [Helicobacter pylori]PDW19640.1 hypothetical protein BB436_02980 [Helicobacter pylori]PDW91583.1 hypothetical protein BB392_05210 [Helicobacter pylori]PDX13640.1 hypothetical protein BB410_06360 [Helicobacter pylori]